MAKAALSEVTLAAPRPSTVTTGKEESWPQRAKPAKVEPVAELRAGDKSLDLPTFAQLFRQYAPYVLHALPFLGVAASDVEDICQDVFTTVYQNIGKFQGRSSIRTWIYGICLNKVLNYRRAAHRRRERLDPSSEQEVESSQLDELEHKRARQLLQQALIELSDDKREVFVLYEIEELSMSEVAQVLGCPLFTAYSRLYAARRDMKTTVERLSVDEYVEDAPRSTCR